MAKNQRVLPKTIIIPRGCILDKAADQVVRHTLHYSILVPVGDDETIEVVMPEEAIAAMYGLSEKPIIL